MSAVDYIDFSDDREDEYRGSYFIEIVKIISETEKAWKLDIKLEDEKIYTSWLPKSQCELTRDKKFIEVPDWLYENKIKELKEPNNGNVSN